MMTKVLAVVLSCLCLAFANPTADPGCKKGPEFWCHSLSNAKSCDQVQYCHATVWKVPLRNVPHAKVDGALECTICEAIVKIVDEAVENNATETQALAELDKLCGSLGPIASLCTGLVNTYFPTIWNLLIQKTDPLTVCTEIKLCTAVESKPITVHTEVKVDGPLECTICEALVKLADGYIENNATEQEVLTALENLCNDLGPVASLCTGLVDTYFPAIWALLIKEADPATVCTEIGLCSSAAPLKTTKAKELKVSHPKLKEGKVDGPLECTICEAIVKLADGYIENNATEQEVETALNNFCNDLGPIASLCTGLVDTYFPAIWALLIKEADPTTVCTEIGLCSSSAAPLKTTKAKELKVSHPKLKEGKVDGPLECTICEAIVKLADGYIENNATEQEVLTALNNFCNDLGPIASLCTGLVDTYFPAIWALLIKEADPTTVCTEIGLCSSSAAPLKTKAKELKVSHPKLREGKVSGTLECTICEAIVKVVDSYVENNATEKEALAALEKLCGELGPIASLCTGLVDTYFPDIWNLLIQEADPTKVCTEIKLCSASSPRVDLNMLIRAKH